MEKKDKLFLWVNRDMYTNQKTGQKWMYIREGAKEGGFDPHM